MKPGYIYLLGNKEHTTLYVGVTNNLERRLWEHKNKLVEGFTYKYNLNTLYYYRYFEDIIHAIEEEKRIKGGSRKDKDTLVESMNPEWKDLSYEIASSDKPPRNDDLVRRNFPIGDKFTWKVRTTAKYYTEIQTEDDLSQLVRSDEFKNCKKQYILGRGANTLFASKEYDGLVIEINTKGIAKIKENSDHVYWRVAAGEDWVELVERMVLKENLGGLENLAYIPGKVGSAPIQNIAAYGEAFEDVCESVEYIDLTTLEHKTCKGKECQFSYRNSKFKSMLTTTDNGFIIWSVILKLTKPSKHTIEAGYFSNYESLQSELTHLEGRRPTIQDIYQAVVSLRKKKLPEVSEIGTNGSLFMNPIVSGSKVKEILEKFPKLQYYPAEKMKYVPNSKLEILNSKEYKIAAGHIFDEIGWKGKMVGKVGTWKNHALVLCNYGTQDPGDIIKVIRMMQDDFEKATGIMLEPEINIVS